MNTITREQYEDLKDAQLFGTREEYHRLLEEYTGIEARSYTAYQYYDGADNYVGDSNEDTLHDILDRAYITVKE